MKDGFFETRKEQIEKDFLRRLIRDLNASGCELTRQARGYIKDELRAAAMVGACEERGRILTIPGIAENYREEITAVPVLMMLGYEYKEPKKRKTKKR